MIYQYNWMFEPFNCDGYDGDESGTGDERAVEPCDLTKRGAPTVK